MCLLDNSKDILKEIDRFYKDIVNNINSNPLLIENLVKYTIFNRKNPSKANLLEDNELTSLKIDKDLLSEKIDKLISFGIIKKDRNGRLHYP
jgi:hypothetical protein